MGAMFSSHANKASFPVEEDDFLSVCGGTVEDSVYVVHHQNGGL